MKQTVKLLTTILFPFFLLFSLVSCPEPMSDDLLAEVEDTAPPVIIILTPDQNQKNYYGSIITIKGKIADYSNEKQTIPGEVSSVSWEEQYNKRLNGIVTLESDGAFTISFSTITPEQLTGTQFLVISATDWNGNTEEYTVTLFDKTTGPAISVTNHQPDDYNVYSSILAGSPLAINGIVGLPSFILTYEVEPQVGTPTPTPVNIPFDSTTGAFTFTFDPNAESMSGNLTFILRANDGKASSTTFILTDDPIAPTMSGSLAWNNDSITVNFSEPVYHTGGTAPLVTDFTPVFIQGLGTATNADLTGFVTAPSPGATAIQFTVAVTGTPDGNETIDVHPVSGMITDRVGNLLATTGSIGPAALHDKTAPSVIQISSPDADSSYYKANQTIPIAILFSEPVVVATGTPALSLNTGASVNYSSGGGTDTLTFTYSVGASENAAPLNYTADNSLTGTITDTEGNIASLILPEPTDTTFSLQAKNFTVDTQAPSLSSITVNDTSLLKGETAAVTFTFSEPVTGFDVGDVSAGNGSLTGLSSSDGGTTFTATFTPTANHESTGNTISVIDSTYTDVAGNNGTGNTSANYAIDTLLPVTTATPDEGSFAGSQNVTLTPSEQSVVYYTTDGTTPTTSSAVYGSPINVNSTTTLKFFAVDTAGNTEAVQIKNYVIDATPPTLDSIVLSSYSIIKNQTATVTFTFSELVTGFDGSDVSAGSGTLAGLSSSDGGTTFTAAFTPTDNLELPWNTISVADSTYTDIAGNNGTGNTSSAYAVDTQAPSLSSITVDDTSLIKGETATVTFTFSEPVTGFDAGDISTANGTLSAPSSSDGGTTFTAAFTPTDNHEATGNTVSVADNTYTDIAGNNGTGKTSAAYDIDTQAPKLAANLAFANGGGSSGTTDAGDTITITYTEAIDPLSIDTGLSAGGSITGSFTALIGKLGSFATPGDIEATNTSLSLSGDGITVVVTLEGAISGTTDPAGAFTSGPTVKDVAGNGVDVSVTKNKTGN